MAMLNNQTVSLLDVRSHMLTPKLYVFMLCFSGITGGSPPLFRVGAVVQQLPRGWEKQQLQNQTEPCGHGPSWTVVNMKVFFFSLQSSRVIM